MEHIKVQLKSLVWYESVCTTLHCPSTYIFAECRCSVQVNDQGSILHQYLFHCKMRQNTLMCKLGETRKSDKIY